MSKITIKQTAAFISICSNATLIILKLTVGFFTGSLSIISEALHSLSDILASFIAYFSVKKSSEPADNDHQFGHGKFEEISGFFEGLLICGISIYIFYTAIQKCLTGYENNFETIWGIVIMTFSVILNIFVSKYIYHIGLKTNSIAIIADAEHLKTDVISSLAVLIGLLIIKLTNFVFIDTIFAFVVAIIIGITGIKVTSKAIKSLLDESLPQEDITLLNEILNIRLNKDIMAITSLKTRKSGSEKLIQITISVDENMTIGKGHDICNEIEDEIMRKLEGAKVIIHLEPYGITDNVKV